MASAGEVPFCVADRRLDWINSEKDSMQFALVSRHEIPAESTPVPPLKMTAEWFVGAGRGPQGINIFYYSN